MSVATAHPSTVPAPVHRHSNGKSGASSTRPAAACLNLDDVRLFWYENFQNGEQVAFSSFIAALSMHFNEHFDRPLFSTLPIPAAVGNQPAFLPVLVNSVLFLCVPDLSVYAQQSSIDPSSVDEPYIRRHQFEQFVRTFGSHLPSAIHLAHYSLFAANGALYSWFHGHDHSFDSYSHQGRDGFLIRFSHTKPGVLTVLSSRAGVWEKRHLTVACDGWQATSETAAGTQTVLGVYRSLNDYIYAHHAGQQPFMSPFVSMFPASLSPSEAGRAWSPTGQSEQFADERAGLRGNCSHSAILSSAAADTPPAVSTFTASDVLSVPAPYPTIATYSIIPVASSRHVSSLPSQSPRSSGSSHPSTPQPVPDSPASSTVIDTGSSVHSDSDVAMSDSDDSQGQQQLVQSTIRSGTGCPSIAVHEFLYAIAMDDVEAVLSFIRYKQIKLTATDDYGLTCLHIACAHNRTRILHILKPHVPVSLLAAVTLKPINASSPLLSTYTAGNQWMPYMKTDLKLPEGSPCGSVACAYQSGGCLSFIQQWLTELGVQYGNIQHASHESLAHKA